MFLAICLQMVLQHRPGFMEMLPASSYLCPESHFVLLHYGCFLTQKFFHVKDLNRKMPKLITNARGILVHFPTAAVQEAELKGGCCRYSDDN